MKGVKSEDEFAEKKNHNVLMLFTLFQTFFNLGVFIIELLDPGYMKFNEVNLDNTYSLYLLYSYNESVASMLLNAPKTHGAKNAREQCKARLVPFRL